MSDDMTVLDGEGIAREAEREFQHNPAFRSKVLLAVAAVRSLNPQPLSNSQEYLATLSASVGLFLHGYEPCDQQDERCSCGRTLTGAGACSLCEYVPERCNCRPEASAGGAAEGMTN